MSTGTNKFSLLCFGAFEFFFLRQSDHDKNRLLFGGV
jgi:hypothetical protein